MEETEMLKLKAFEELSTALSRAQDPALIGDFLKCLLTPSELQEVSSRWALVREIDAGTTQREIARKMGLSLCKITRGSRELKKDHSPFKQMIDIYTSATGPENPVIPGA
jgi:TrpR family trp operon transcriptional repressor